MTQIIITPFFLSMVIAFGSPFSGISRNLAKPDESAQQLLRNAVEAMGGEEKLRSLKTVVIEGIGHTYLIEQSERPEGPWIVNYQQITELRDYYNHKLRRTTRARSGNPSNETRAWAGW